MKIENNSFAKSMMDLISRLYRYKTLVYEMVKRDIQDRYMGQVIGTLWTIGHPLILMLVYTVVFGCIFASRAQLPGSYDYAIYILSGLIPWLCIQESMARGCGLIVQNSNLVKQVLFPIEVLPAKSVLAAFVSQILATVFLCLYILLRYWQASWFWLLLPLVWLIQIVGMCGISFFLSIIGVYMRDIKDIVNVFCTVNFFLMPMIYISGTGPEWLDQIFRFNPFSYVVWVYQDILFYNRIVHPVAWLVMTVGAMVLLVTGYSFFRKVKPGLGNVI